MKKIIMSILAILMVILLLTVVAGCGNHSLTLDNQSYKKVHIFIHDGDDLCLTVRTWCNAENGVVVKTKEYDGELWFSAGTYMLCEGECPICGNKKSDE